MVKIEKFVIRDLKTGTALRKISKNKNKTWEVCSFYTAPDAIQYLKDKNLDPSLYTITKEEVDET